jgi:RNA polymerase sigma-70 factor (ECF subfamily)
MTPSTLKPALRLVEGEGAEAQRYAETVQAFLAGSEEAFAQLASLHQRTVYAVVRRYVARPEDAKDLTQKALLQAYAARPKVLGRLSQEPFAFKAWLLRIAVNVGKNHARMLRLWRMEPVGHLTQVEDGHQLPGAELELNEQRKRLRAAIVKLPPRQQEVVSLRLDGELSFAEIGEALGITENNAVVNFHYAVRKLKSLLGEEAP